MTTEDPRPLTACSHLSAFTAALMYVVLGGGMVYGAVMGLVELLTGD